MANAINRKWARGIGEDGQPVYAPLESIVVNGRTVFWPKDKHYRLAACKEVADEMPPDFDTPDGKHYVAKGWAEIEGKVQRVYELADKPPQTIRISKSKVEAEVDVMGKTADFFAWLNSKAAYIGGWMRGGDEVQYDPEAHGGDLASLIAALGVPEEAVAALIEKVRA